jgi:CBS domain-containing protein
MKAADIMTPRVITIHDDAPVDEAARLMLQDDISGLPVVDRAGKLVGIVTEGDFLRRVEAGTEVRRPHWLELMMEPGLLAAEYVHTHGRRIREIMTQGVITVAENAELEAIVLLMEQLRVKRVVVTRDGQPVGIISRSNLLQALAKIDPETGPTPGTDDSIRERILAEMGALVWMPSASINPVVRFGVVDLHGFIFDERERAALRVLAENVPGVSAVHDRLVLVEPSAPKAPFSEPARRALLDAGLGAT